MVKGFRPIQGNIDRELLFPSSSKIRLSLDKHFPLQTPVLSPHTGMLAMLWTRSRMIYDPFLPDAVLPPF